MKRPETVDAYIAGIPKKLRGKLKELRVAIRKAAPKAEERISYGMPYYGYKGRLVYFRLAKNHIGLYIPAPVVKEHKEELKDYDVAEATIRFPLDKKLPVKLIQKLVRMRMKMNESRVKK